MAHQLIQLSRRVFNTPQLISVPNMVMIAEYLNSRNNGTYRLDLLPEEPAPQMAEKENHGLSYSPSYSTGVIEISGVLTNIAFEGICGEVGCSYEQIQEDFISLVALGAKTVVLEVNSGGGEAYGCFEAALNVRKIADDNGVRIVTYVNGVAFSAAYAWASIADEVITNPMAEVGSIGVVVQLVNYSRYDKEKGIDTLYLYAGKSKIPFDDTGAFKDTFIESIQKKIDAFYGYFVGFVSLTRNISEEAVRNTEAETYLPQQALELGLIDQIMTKNDFISYIFKGNN